MTPASKYLSFYLILVISPINFCTANSTLEPDDFASQLGNPGIKVRLSQYGLNNATNSLIRIFSDAVQNISNSGCSNFTSFGGFMTAYFCWSQLKISNFVPFNLTASPAEDNYLKVQTDDGNIHLETDFQYEVLMFPFPWVIESEKTIFKLSSSNLSVLFYLKINTDSMGNPVAEMDSCKASAQLSYTIEGSFLPKMLLWAVKALYLGWDKFLQNVICHNLDSQLKRAVKKQITIQYHIDHYLFDYRLLSPLLTNKEKHEIDVLCVGDVLWYSSPYDYPFPKQPPQLPSFRSNKMGTIFVTNHVFESFSYTAFRHSQLSNLKVSRNTFKDSKKNSKTLQLFQTSCPKNESGHCQSFSELLPHTVGVDYPGKFVCFNLTASEYPNFHFTHNQSYLSLQTYFSMSICEENDEITHPDVIVLHMEVKANLSVSIENSDDSSRIALGGDSHMNLNVPFHRFTVIRNQWNATTNDTDIYSLFYFTSELGEALISKALKHLPIPITNDKFIVRLSDSQLLMMNDSIIIDTDFVLKNPELLLENLLNFDFVPFS